MATVSVIIPCYRYGHYLPGCVASVLKQDGVDVRVLVIDDASPDNSGEVAQALARRDDRVEVRRHVVNCGHIETYNEGLEWAAGDYLLLISADDLLLPGALRRAARLLDAHPEVGLTYGRQVAFRDKPPRPRGAGADACLRIVSGTDFIASCCAVGHNPVTTPTVVVRTAVQKRLGGYNKDLPHTADLELWLRFAAHGNVGIIDADQALKRAHASNMQLDFTVRGIGDIRQREAAFAAFFRGQGAAIPRAASLWRQAQAALAESAFWTASHAFDRGDAAACRELLNVAVTLNPELPGGRSWRRLAWKRRMGPRLWRCVRPLVERRRAESAPAIARTA
jgi:glycosyltransferase involved in cell wall biosynthesis